jgi:Short C-terminal domain/Phospholipase_D-nuclease N-terminal
MRRGEGLALAPTNDEGGHLVLLAADYPFLDVLWTLLIFFAWVIWFWILITVFADLFRRHDIGGGAKVLWSIFVIILPFLGVFIYLLTQNTGMVERRRREAEVAQGQFNDYVRTVAASGGSAGEIEKAKQLLDSGAITQSEYEALKAKALGAT